MRTHPSLRKRYPSTNVIVGGLSQIIAGIFGTGSPTPGLVEQASVVTRGFYHFHQGDLFLPGTGNYVLDPSHETPLQTVWGHGFLIQQPNYVGPYGPPPLISHPAGPVVGVGGPIAGQIIFQPLTVRQEGG